MCIIIGYGEVGYIGAAVGDQSWSGLHPLTAYIQCTAIRSCMMMIISIIIIVIIIVNIYIISIVIEVTIIIISSLFVLLIPDFYEIISIRFNLMDF